MPLFIAVAATFLQQTLTYMSHLVVPVAAPVLSNEFKLPIALAGAHMGIVYFFGSVFQLFAGEFIRKYGAARMSQVALASTAAGLIMGAIGELWAYAFGAFVIGAGSAFSTPASSDILARFAPPKHAPLIFSIKKNGGTGRGYIGRYAGPISYKRGWLAKHIFNFRRVLSRAQYIISNCAI